MNHNNTDIFTGALVFIYLELPDEEEKKKLKLEKNIDVDNAVNYLKTIFWQYANNEKKYNYTRDEFRQTVSKHTVPMTTSRW